MTKVLRWIPALALCAAMLPAQEPQEAQDPAQREFAELTKAYDQARREFLAEFREQQKKAMEEAKKAGENRPRSIRGFSYAELDKKWRL